MNTKRQICLFGALIVSSFMLMLGLCAFGSASLSLSEVFQAFLYRFFGLGDKVKNNGAIVYLRLVRTALAYLVGAALSVSGAAMQAVFGNPLADPHILGVSSGAALGAAVATVFAMPLGLFGLSAVSVCAFIGGLLAAGIVLSLSRINGRAGTAGLLLSGVAMSALLSALLSGLLAFHKESAETVYMWTMGSFGGATEQKIRLLLAVFIIGFISLMCLSRELNLLLLGERQALSLGVNVRAVRTMAVVISSLLTAVAVSLCGVIGFVGLMLPHAARRFAGSDHKRLLPVCALAGGIFMMIVDTLARSLTAVEIPVGVITGLLGGPFFLYLIRSGRKSK